MDSYLEDPGFKSRHDGFCPVCDQPYEYAELIAKAPPRLWRGKFKYGHLACVLQARRESVKQA